MTEGIQRRKARLIHVGPVALGGTAPIRVQSMTNTFTQDVDATVGQIRRLERAGCEIVRVAVPDKDAAAAVARIKQRITVPLIADVHFDYRLAIAAAEAGADGLRINPGNIGSPRKVRAVVDCARERDLPIRVGVNAGSLEKERLRRYGGATAEAMVASAVENIAMLEDLGFGQIKVSLKASDVPRTVDAYRLLADRTDVPLHVGVTEAGGLFPGVVKSALGIGMLLAGGIGDTLRVSLTRDPVEEVRVGFEILKALDIRRHGPEIIACPTCGRTRIDLFSLLEEAEQALMTCRLPLKIAIMGCVVNGPGEAREADLGIAGADGKGVLFRRGEVVETLPQEQLLPRLLAEVKRLEEQAEKTASDPTDGDLPGKA